MTPDIFMVAGEMSGDLLGSHLIEGLLAKRNDLDIVGIGGPKMRAQGLYPTTPLEELQVMGFIDVVKHLPHLYKVFKTTLNTILHLNPKAVVTIDYPGFNLRLAKALRKRGYQGKLCHVVCPSVWAWGKDRIETLAHHYDLLLTLLPFEKNLFKENSLRVEYIGHPLAKQIAFEHAPDENLIALYPGSRSHEIEKNLPYFLRLIPKLPSNYRYSISLSQEKYRPLIRKQTSFPFLTPADKPAFALAKCGTIALELGLKGIPTVVTYKISPLDVFLAKKVFRINLPYYSLPNLILNHQLFPELIGPALSDNSLFEATTTLLKLHNLRACHLECQKLKTLLTSDTDPAALILSLI